MPTTEGADAGAEIGSGTDGTAVTDLSGLAARVGPGETVALGGKTLHRAPMGFVRELVRRGVDGLVPIGLANSMDVDLLAGTGGAAAVHYGYVGFEAFGLAPNFRAAVESGGLDAREGTCYTVATALRAAAQGVPYLPIAGLADSDLLAVGSDYLAETDDPFTGETVRAVRRVRPDVGVIHATAADPAGNARFDGADLTETLVAKASDRTLVTAERIVEPGTFAADPGATDVPGVLVDAVAEVPYGAHPCSCPGAYDYDATHLREYLDRSRAGDLDDYLDTHLGDSEGDYRDRAIADPAALAWERTDRAAERGVTR